MAAIPLLLTAAASLVAATCFAGVAVALRRRRFAPELAQAGQAYVLWWSLFSLQALTDATRTLLATVTPINAQLYVALAALKIVAAGVGIWALGRYVLFLLGREERWMRMGLGMFSGAHILYFLAGLQSGLPAKIVVDTWAPRLVLTGPGIGLPLLGTATLLLFFLPAIVLAVAYMFVARRLETRTQKARVIAIALAILVFQVVGTIQFNPATPANSPMFAILPLVSALMGLLVLATYKPPAWLSRVFHIEPLARVPGASRAAQNGVH